MASAVRQVLRQVGGGGAAQHSLRMLMVGCPGSGKGTLSERIVKEFPVEHVTAGDILRRHIRDGTDIGLEAAKVIRAGRLMPDETMMELIHSELKMLGEKNWILDGFPRTLGQAELLTATLVAAEHPLSLVVNLVVPEEVILQRILDRWTHIPSGRVYNMSFNPPKCPGFDDITGEPLEKREDDNPETFKKRIAAFHEKTEPMISLFRSMSCPTDPSRPLVVDLAGSTSNEIWPKLQHVLRERFPYFT